MKQVQTFTSTYTADVSGVCSALFELGGMTVMNDASGCNSTYNTHDEPRWYDHDSLVFISALSEMEAVMGDDEKLIGDIVRAAEELHPAFIAIAGTPIPMMTGCDIPAIAAEVESRTGIPSFGFQTNGMHPYVSGAAQALAAYAERFVCSDVHRKTGTVNILGATPLDFSVNGSVESMKKVLEAGGFDVLSTWAMNCTPEELQGSGAAAVNLVVSSAGLPLARILRKKFNAPYVIGTPCGADFNKKLLLNIEEAAADGRNRIAYSQSPEAHTAENADIAVIGESVTAHSLASAVSAAGGKRTAVICPIEAEPETMSAGDICSNDEDEIAAALGSFAAVIADPLYKPLVPQSCRFYDLPHEAFSGRCFRSRIPNLVEKDIKLFLSADAGFFKE